MKIVLILKDTKTKIYSVIFMLKNDKCIILKLWKNGQKLLNYINPNFLIEEFAKIQKKKL